MFTDNVSARKEDQESVNVQDPMELRYWSNLFGVTKEDILKAVREEGPTRQGIERYIERVNPRIVKGS